MKIYLEGVGLLGPGFTDWTSGREILAGRSPYRAEEVLLPVSEMLPPAERRRMTNTVRLALAVGSEAMAQTETRPEATPSVFASSGGDGATVTAILEILTSEEREVSPTRFHNSVHNAPSGYWSIATGSQEASTSVCGHDFSFAAGLLEAAGQVLAGRKPVLLVAYDLPYPPPLHAARPIFGIFGAALILTPHPTSRSLAALSLKLAHGNGSATVMAEPALETLRSGNPAARSLPLLAAVAGAAEREVALPSVAGNLLTVRVTPP